MKTKRIFFVGVGGQGNLLSSRLLGEAALASGVAVNMSETHGMAQRGGVVESTVVLGGARSAVISPAEADVIVAFEPLEALRALPTANRDTVVITSTAKVPPFTVAIGQGQYPEVEEALQLLRSKVGKVVALNALDLAVRARNPLGVNMVMLGALSAAGDLPIKPKAIKEAIGRESKAAFAESNQKCFELGFAAAKEQA